MRERVPARVYLLSAGAFAVGTSAYIGSGMLPAVAAALGVSLTAAGQLTTAFALAYALGAPLPAPTQHREHRRAQRIGQSEGRGQLTGRGE